MLAWLQKLLEKGGPSLWTFTKDGGLLKINKQNIIQFFKDKAKIFKAEGVKEAKNIAANIKADNKIPPGTVLNPAQITKALKDLHKIKGVKVPKATGGPKVPRTKFDPAGIKKRLDKLPSDRSLVKKQGTAVISKKGTPPVPQKGREVKLTSEQRGRSNDIGGETNRRNAQEFVRGEINVPVREKSINKKGEEVIQQKEVEGELVTRKMKNSNRIADVLPDGTIRFDKGVSKVQAGRSAFPRLGL